MSGMKEWHWDSLSYIITPSYLSNTLNTCDSESLETFGRVRSTVFLRMFQFMRCRFFHHIEKHGCSLTTVVFLFQKLSNDGFIPKYSNRGLPCNDYFGFINDRKQWEELPFCSLDVIRLYWDSMFKNTTKSHRTEIEKVCQSIILCLPGVLYTCNSCRWKIPESQMYSDHMCGYCHTLCKSGKLDLHKQVCYIKHPTETQEEQLLSEKLTQMNIICSCSNEVECGLIVKFEKLLLESKLITHNNK